MTSFNILGVCTSRDIFSQTEGEKKYQIKKYTLGFSPLFVFEDGLKIDKESFDSVELGMKIHQFGRRACYLEFTHSVFDFITQEQSDYLIIDLSLLRNSYFLTEDGHYFIYGRKKLRLYEEMVEKLNLPAVKEKSIPCDFLPQKEVEKRLKAYAAKLLALYRPEQIILCEHKHSRLSVCGDMIRSFRNFDETYGRGDKFVNFAFTVMKDELKGCHVINYLSNAFADAHHRLGKSPLHYIKEYYQYCIDLIVQKLPSDEEESKLRRLYKKWNRTYALKYFNMLKKMAVSQFESRELERLKEQKKGGKGKIGSDIPEDFL